MKNALLIIDAQNDFCLPTGNLPVLGAMDDIKRLCKFIENNLVAIDSISMTMDAHHTIDISHPSFWENKDGNNPPPFTGIGMDFLQDVLNGVWTARFYPAQAVQYLRDLKSQGEFNHTIWPYHCIMGSHGAAFVDELMETIRKWEMQGKFKQIVTKGTNPLTEHYGAFRAQVDISGKPETQINQAFLKTLENYQNVFIAGEASSHCVATTLKQAVEYAPQLIHKLVVLEDAMSPVAGCENLADHIYADARAKGVRFEKTTIKL